MNLSRMFIFLAPSGSQDVTLSVCPFVCLFSPKLSVALNLNFSGSGLSQVSLSSPILLHTISRRSLNTFVFYLFICTILVIVHYRAVSVEEVLRVD